MSICSINCKNFDDFLALYDVDVKIQKLIDEHADKCEECLCAKKAWLSIKTGKPNLSDNPDYQQIAKNVYDRLQREPLPSPQQEGQREVNRQAEFPSKKWKNRKYQHRLPLILKITAFFCLISIAIYLWIVKQNSENDFPVALVVDGNEFLLGEKDKIKEFKLYSQQRLEFTLKDKRYVSLFHRYENSICDHLGFSLEKTFFTPEETGKKKSIDFEELQESSYLFFVSTHNPLPVKEKMKICEALGSLQNLELVERGHSSNQTSNGISKLPDVDYQEARLYWNIYSVNYQDFYKTKIIKPTLLAKIQVFRTPFNISILFEKSPGIFSEYTPGSQQSFQETSGFKINLEVYGDSYGSIFLCDQHQEILQIIPGQGNQYTQKLKNCNIPIQKRHKFDDATKVLYLCIFYGKKQMENNMLCRWLKNTDLAKYASSETNLGKMLLNTAF